MINDNALENILYALPFNIRQAIYRLSPTAQSNVSEIRLRKNLPLALTISGETVFLKPNGQTCFTLENDIICINENDINECFLKLCENSVFAHENELREGFIAMRHGGRAGVCGRFNNGGTVADVTSLNLRISREVKGCANKLLSQYSQGGLLIAGPPASGKTTLLRDLIRQLTNGESGKIYRCAVIDTRREISGGGRLDLGVASDIIITDKKADGIEKALRTMFPDIIAFDEIGTLDELNAVSQSFFSGVKIITTAHIESVFDLKNREITRRLLESQAIDQVAVLPKIVGGKITVMSLKEIFKDVAV